MIWEIKESGAIISTINNVRNTVSFHLSFHAWFSFSFTFFFYWAQQSPVDQGLLIREVARSHTATHHSRQDSFGRVITPSQRPLPENTQHSQQTSMPPVGFEPTISADERSQTYAIDRAVAGTSMQGLQVIIPR